MNFWQDTLPRPSGFVNETRLLNQTLWSLLISPVELSVTRHLNLAENHIWMIGKKIAAGIPRTLHGRADVEAAHVIAQHLAIVPQPEQDNPNHANIVGWSSDKDVRKIRAMEIARVARFIPNPEIAA